MALFKCQNHKWVKVVLDTPLIINSTNNWQTFKFKRPVRNIVFDFDIAASWRRISGNNQSATVQVGIGIERDGPSESAFYNCFANDWRESQWASSGSIRINASNRHKVFINHNGSEYEEVNFPVEIKDNVKFKQIITTPWCAVFSNTYEVTIQNYGIRILSYEELR